jgi:hypothetical protein
LQEGDHNLEEASHTCKSKSVQMAIMEGAGAATKPKARQKKEATGHK